MGRPCENAVSHTQPISLSVKICTRKLCGMYTYVHACLDITDRSLVLYPIGKFITVLFLFAKFSLPKEQGTRQVCQQNLATNMRFPAPFVCLTVYFFKACVTCSYYTLAHTYHIIARRQLNNQYAPNWLIPRHISDYPFHPIFSKQLGAR